MSKLRVHCFTVSADGYGAGPEQDLENPLGVGGFGLHKWMVRTDTFQKMMGGAGGETGVDNDFTARGFENIGAWILGRNMFGPVRGPWPDEEWKGWWGEEPPYHVPVFVLTHHPRPDLVMKGGTVFKFVTGGIEEALRLAREAAGTKDVRVGGGVATVREYLRAGLVDEMHVAMSPVVLGRGEALFAGIDLPALGYRVRESVTTPLAMHLMFDRQAQ